jgi:hypothetical protein
MPPPQIMGINGVLLRDHDHDHPVLRAHDLISIHPTQRIRQKQRLQCRSPETFA